MSDSASVDSNSVIMSEDSDTILIESLEAQVEDLQFESKLLKTKIKELEIRIKVLQNISDSELVNQIFHYLYGLILFRLASLNKIRTPLKSIVEYLHFSLVCRPQSLPQFFRVLPVPGLVQLEWVCI